MWCLAEGRLRYFIELLCLIRFSREPSILRQSPGCLHHAMLSPGIFKTATGVHALVLCSHEFWWNVNIFLFLCPQVHGVANDTIKFVQNIINTEINSATDNPVSFLPLKTDLGARILQPRLYLNCLYCLFFLDWFPRWFLQKEARQFQVEISMVNIQPRWECVFFFFLSVCCSFFLVSCVTLSFLAGSGLFIYCSPWVGLYQWEEDWKVV